MKFLHLSDLHIGKTVNGFSMLAEQAHIFKQIVSYVKSEGVGAVVMAGDIYDRAIPGVDAVELFDDFLTGLAELVPVLVISGNHDSPERLNYASRLLRDKQIFLAGVFDGKLSPVTLYDEYGEINFWLLPFIRPSSVRGMFDSREIESCSDAFRAALETADIDYGSRNILVAHQFFTMPGTTPSLSDSEINLVGGLDAVDAGMLLDFDYAALGHLHRNQKVGSANIRYAGSPLKYSFSEWRHDKSALLVEVKEKGSLTVTELPLLPIHDMREIKGPLEKLINPDVSGLADAEDYLRVILTDDEEIIDPMGKLRSVYPNVMALEFENSRTGIDISETMPDMEKIGQLSPYGLFSEFFLDLSGAVMSEEQSKIVLELLDGMGDSL